MDTPSALLGLEGRTALVSGASSPLGAAIARTLAAAGARLVLHCHTRRDGAGALAQDLRTAGRESLVLQADLAADGEPARVLGAAAEAGFAPDILVNNAARQDVVPLESLSPQDWRAMFAVTLDGAFALSQAFCAACMAAGKPGAIVNIASIEGLAPAAGHAHYASAKAALLQFTRAAALEYGPHRIRVNAVSPGLIDRPGLAQDWPEGVARWQAGAPLGRLGTAQDVARAVLFLAAPMSSWISGANLVVDGGMMSGGRW